jgi:hypothetical protein
VTAVSPQGGVIAAKSSAQHVAALRTRWRAVSVRERDIVQSIVVRPARGPCRHLEIIAGAPSRPLRAKNRA